MILFISLKLTAELEVFSKVLVFPGEQYNGMCVPVIILSKDHQHQNVHLSIQATVFY
jgi:hypothetical protein